MPIGCYYSLSPLRRLQEEIILSYRGGESLQKMLIRIRVEEVIKESDF